MATGEPIVGLAAAFLAGAAAISLLNFWLTHRRQTDRLRSWRQEQAEWQRQQQVLEGHLAEMAEEKARLTSALDLAQGDKFRFSLRAADHDIELRNVRAECEALRKVVDQSNDVLNEAHAAHQSEVNKLRTELDALRIDQRNWQSEITQLRYERNAFHKELESKQAINRELNEADDASPVPDIHAKQLEELKHALDTAQSQLIDLRERHAADKNAFRDAEQRWSAALLETKHEHDTEIERYQHEILELKARFEEMQSDAIKMSEGPISITPRPTSQSKADGGDDLKRITGIGPAIERLLHGQGIRSYKQVAAWSKADIDELTGRVPQLKGRIVRERWVESAQRLQSDQDA